MKTEKAVMSIKKIRGKNKNKLLRRLRFIYIKILREKKNPKYNARGVALGLFVGMTPTMGIQMYIAVPLSILFKANPILAALLVWITNPVTFIPIYAFNFMVGATILAIKSENSLKFLNDLLDYMQNIFFNPEDIIILFEKYKSEFWNLFLALNLGCLLVGIILALAGYYITLRIIKKH